MRIPDMSQAKTAAVTAAKLVEVLAAATADITGLLDHLEGILDTIYGKIPDTPPPDYSGDINAMKGDIQQLALAVSALSNNNQAMLTEFQGAILNFSNIAGGVEALNNYVPYMLQYFSAYSFDTAGVNQFEADLAAGSVQGSDTDLVLYVDNPTGGRAPVINPKLLTYSSPSGERYSILETLVDCLNQLHIYPSGAAGIQEVN